MTAPLVNELRRHVPGLRLTLQGGPSRAQLATRFDGPFDHLPEIPDFGAVMVSATDVRAQETYEGYRHLHADLSRLVAAEAERIAGLRPDLVLANIPYVTIAAAARAGVPVVAYSSLNWVDIGRAFLQQRPGGEAILAEMQAAYAQADLFLLPTPTMPMAWAPHRRIIGPVARPAQADRPGLRARLGLPADQLLALVAFGGFDPELTLGDIPQMAGWRWLANGEVPPAMMSAAGAGMAFSDILASVDLVLGKPGYGTFAEVAAAGVPMLYLPRTDWPEAQPLVAWLERQGAAQAITADQVRDAGRLAEAVTSLRGRCKPPVPPTGNRQGARLLFDLLAARYPGLHWQEDEAP